MDSLIVFVLLQIADFTTTLLVLRLGGSEQNPLVRQFIGAFGVNGLVIAKTLVVVAGTVMALARKYRAVRIANMLFAAVITWNVVVIARLTAHVLSARF